MKKTKKAAAKVEAPKIHPTTIVATRTLKPHPRNYRKHPEAQVDEIVESIKQHGIYKNIVVARDGTILAGHGMVLGASKIGMAKLPVVRLAIGPDHPRALKIVAADNELARLAEDDDRILADILREIREKDEGGLSGTGYDDAALDQLLASLPSGSDLVGGDDAERPTLRERFGVPPFTVFDARQGYWQDRKRLWIALGDFDRDEARAGVHSWGNPNASAASTLKIMSETAQPTSIFDPVLAELLVRWFSGKGATVLDPFAGGAVRGFVSAMLGRRYVGIDLSEKQVEINRKTWTERGDAKLPKPTYLAGDSARVLALANGASKVPDADLILSCPPYGDLERYSDDPNDLSNMPWENFLESYRSIIARACARTKPNAFAAWVVGDFRDADGHYRNFVSETIAAFHDAGFRLYNEGILVTAIASLSLRVATPFETTRKLGKAHQNVLVFLRGDARKLAESFGDVEFGAVAPSSATGGEKVDEGVERIELDESDDE